MAYEVRYRWDHEKNCVSVEKTKLKTKRKKIYIPASYAKKKKKQRDEKVGKVYQLLPSVNGIKMTDGYECAIPKTLDQLTDEARGMKEHLETHLKNRKGSEFLLKAVDHIIHMLARFSSEIVLPAFDWDLQKYPKQRRKISSNNTSMNVENTGKLAKNGVRHSESGLVPPGSDSRGIAQVGTMRKVPKYRAKNYERSFVLPGFLCGIAQVNGITGNDTDKAYACVPSSSDPNRKLPLSDNLSINEKKIWQVFEEFDKGNPEVQPMSFKAVKEVGRSIQIDHPIVSVIGGFAVAAFNEACEMYVKKDEPNNLHDFEFMECKYLKLSKTYYFYMIIEAIEEGNLGVYETQVVCSSDGNMRTLAKFFLTDWKPIGTKAMAVALFSSLRCVCKTVEGVAEEKRNELSKVLAVITEVWEQGLPIDKMCCISELRTEIIEGLDHLLFLGHSMLFSPDCNRTTNPGVWSHPDNNFYDVMVPRTNGTTCRGYDYHDPYSMGRGH